MKPLTIYILLVFTLILGTTVQAQNSRMDKAYADYQLKNYGGAARQFVRLLNNEKDPAMLDSLYRLLGNSYNKLNKYKQAIYYYNKYLVNHKNDYPIKQSLANNYLKTGDVDNALVTYTALVEADTSNTTYKRMVENCRFAIYEINKPNKPLIRNQELINSKQSEFGLAFYGDQLIFSSHRVNDEFSSIHGRIDQGFSNLYSAVFDSVLNVYKDPYPLAGKINTNFNEGAFTFSDSLQMALFTRCSKNPDVCQICKAKNIKDKWDFISTVQLGNEKYNYAHPCISSDGGTLYFASDLPGGYGGHDIWKASISATGDIGKPENLGATINTPDNEMFPFVVGDSILLFASNGHIGMGGLDMYYAFLENGIYDKPVNIGAPLNSTSDDFSILLYNDLRGGYFCSNRDNEAKSDDIYAFYHNIFLKDIFGSVVEAEEFTPLDQVKIIYATNGVDKTIAYTDTLGKFFIPNSAHVSCGLTHTLLVEKEGFLTQNITVPCYAKEETVILLDDGEGRCHELTGIITNIRTKQPVPGAEITIKSLRGTETKVYAGNDGRYTVNCIQPDDYLVIRVMKTDYLSDSKVIQSPKEDKIVSMSSRNGYDTDFQLIPIAFEVEFEIENIYYEFDKARLLPASEFSLNKLVNLLNENPPIKIRINSHADERGNDKYNLKLSDKRSASVVNYLVEHGISRNRLMSLGFGETQLIVKNAQTEAEHQQNRRTTFEIIGNLSVAASGSGALYDIPDAANKRDILLFDKIKKAGESGSDMSDETLMGLKVTESSAEFKVPPPATGAITSTTFRVQLVATSKSIDVIEKFPGIKNIIQQNELHVERSGKLYKYQLGNFKTKAEADQLKRELVASGYKECFVVKITN